MGPSTCKLARQTNPGGMIRKCCALDADLASFSQCATSAAHGPRPTVLGVDQQMLVPCLRHRLADKETSHTITSPTVPDRSNAPRHTEIYRRTCHFACIKKPNKCLGTLFLIRSCWPFCSNNVHVSRVLVTHFSNFLLAFPCHLPVLLTRSSFSISSHKIQ